MLSSRRHALLPVPAQEGVHLTNVSIGVGLHGRQVPLPRPGVAALQEDEGTAGYARIISCMRDADGLVSGMPLSPKPVWNWIGFIQLWLSSVMVWQSWWTTCSLRPAWSSLLKFSAPGCVSLLVNARKYAACVSSIRVTRNRQPSAVTNDGLEPYRTLSAMSTLAKTYNKKGKNAKAKILQLEILEIKRQTFGVSHSETLDSMVDLASTCYNRGLYAQAEELQIQVL